MDIGAFFGWLFTPITFLFHYVAYQPVFNILMLIYHFLGSFGLSIVVLTLLMRTALIPVTRAQLRNSRAMQQLAPQLKALQAKYPNSRRDPEEMRAMMAAQQQLYKDHGTHPASGCLPLLIQLPFLYALYYSFYAVLQAAKLPNGKLESVAHHIARVNADIYPFIPHLTHLPATHFLWVNLATSDATHILPIMAALLTFLQMRMTMPQPTPGAPVDATSQSLRMMQYVAPAMTLFIALTVPAGLPLYWTITTTFSAVQQFFINGKKFRPDPVVAPATTSAAPTLATARAARAASAAPPQVVPSEAPQGLFARLRVQYDAIRKSMEEQIAATRVQAATNANTVEGSVEPSDLVPSTKLDEKSTGSSTYTGNGYGNGAKTSTTRASAGTAARRQTRTNRPQLIKPSALPEQRLAQDAASSDNGKNILPEDAIARDAASDSVADDGQG